MQWQQKLKGICQSSIKKRKKHDYIVFLAKSKLNAIEVLISKAFIDSYNDHDESIWVSNVLREYNKMKNKIKNLEIYYMKTMETYCVVKSIPWTKILV